ncbi:membrane protein [Pontibacillus halophilus JSM 076056 = DSM 19796]|uniref:Membrane protein n=1 Tax=Pontibacillus halophilus JSM 076056 = DSM 19796 TaxID=1385510 RepID=A0A0A5GMR7_9BACI|nr:sporulation integral membrane protein YtvI [Pontibacillus halophilus]KGX93294.1 membrane protein [Pontibacillus halophilus JSM 076056 = DSM 19796]
MLRKITKRQWILLFLSIVTVIAAYFILPVSVPLIIAFITALFLGPGVRLLQYRFKLKRRLSVITVYISFLIILGIVGTYVVTRVVTETIQFVENIPSYIRQLENYFNEQKSTYDRFTEGLPEPFVSELESGVGQNLQSLRETVASNETIENLASVAASIPELLVSLIVYLIALFLFMLEMPRLKKMAFDHMTDQTAEKVKFMSNRLSYVVFGFLKAQFLVSIVIFIVTLIGLLFISPNVALLMSFIIWIIDFIPIIGSIAILGPWALYMLIIGEFTMGTELAILAILLLAIRRTVEPKVMGRHIGLSPLATLIAMYIGLQLIGFLGFFVGPLVVIAFNSAKEAGIIKTNFKI